MKRRILLALDGSEGSIKAAAYAADVLRGRPDVVLTLFHVQDTVPPELLEYNEEISRDGLHARQRQWEAVQYATECECFEPIVEMLRQAGFDDDQIVTRHFAPLPGFDTAHVILKECESGDYDTVILGRRGSALRRLLAGSVAQKVVRHGEDLAVWVIG